MPASLLKTCKWIYVTVFELAGKHWDIGGELLQTTYQLLMCYTCSVVRCINRKQQPENRHWDNCILTSLGFIKGMYDKFLKMYNIYINNFLSKQNKSYLFRWDILFGLGKVYILWMSSNFTIITTITIRNQKMYDFQLTAWQLCELSE